MSDQRENYSILTFGIDSKLHENLKIRLYYDQIRNQSQFFRMCVESYLAQDKLFMEFFDAAKVEMQTQSKSRAQNSRTLRQKGENLMKELSLSSAEVENIFDLLEEELPEL
jgi:hypothetical protein